MRRIPAAAVLVTVALITGCSASPTPAPSGSASPETIPGAPTAPAISEDAAWLVTATTTLFSASTRLCPGDGFVTTPDDPDWGAVRTEINGGPPDDWDGGAWTIDQGVTVDVAAKQYYFHYTTGGDSFQVARGSLTVEYDDEGRPRSGSGSGAMEVLLADGSGEDRVDTMTFTVEPVDTPAWCTE